MVRIPDPVTRATPARLEPALFEAMLAGSLWGVYQLLGKLCPTLHLLRKGY